MKRKYAMKALFALLLVFNALFFTSCSSLWLRRGQTVDSVQQGTGTSLNSSAPVVASTVSKEQYDELARKYQELLNQSKNLIVKTETPAAPTPPADNVQAKPEVGASTSIDPSELVNRIDKAIPDMSPADAVDALKPEGQITNEKGPAVPSSMGVQNVNNTDDIDEQITRLREVQELVKVNKFDKALTLLKELENSKEKQIVVRAKLMLGDLLFNQGEYDLASQVYEEVIKKYAFSGYVLKALGKLVACSEKLKQPEKQAKYYSLLHDFFEAS
ncbi:MAG: tetratricopeptide repeat protein [Bacteriovorax sp.]|nr:tetratricopeptide repeat protein [Bacteriovorax sp.]